MIDKEPRIKRNRISLRFLGKAALPIIAGGLALSGQESEQVSKVSPSFPSDTPAPTTTRTPSFHEGENQIAPIDAQEITALRHSIEDKFGIELQTFDNISQNPATKLFYGFENLLSVNQEWNENNLELLGKLLEYIPSDFYKPRSGEKVNVILGPTSHCGHDIKGLTPKYAYEVMLSYSLFRPEKPLTAALVTTHEFGHLMTTESCNSSLNLTYIDKLEEILEKDFTKVQEELHAQIDDRADEFGVKVNEEGVLSSVDSLMPENEEALRLTRLNYGTKNSKEFMAVLFESYFMGKDYFRRMYEPFFPRETVDSLYKFARTDIFDGIEYPDYQTTAVKLKS